MKCNQNVIESKRIEKDESHPFIIQELRGAVGGTAYNMEVAVFNKNETININKKTFSLADYHQKYYKPYYNIYYKN